VGHATTGKGDSFVGGDYSRKSEESSLVDVLFIKRWRNIPAKKPVEKKFKLQYQIFFIEICSVVLYLCSVIEFNVE
jgi:hypothetical protein